MWLTTTHACLRPENVACKEFHVSWVICKDTKPKGDIPSVKVWGPEQLPPQGNHGLAAASGPPLAAWVVTPWPFCHSSLSSLGPHPTPVPWPRPWGRGGTPSREGWNGKSRHFTKQRLPSLAELRSPVGSCCRRRPVSACLSSLWGRVASCQQEQLVSLSLWPLLTLFHANVLLDSCSSPVAKGKINEYWPYV